MKRLSWQSTAFALGAALTGAVAIHPPALGLDAGGVAFLDSRPVEIEVASDHDDGSASVDVINGGASQTIALRVVDLRGAESDVLPIIQTADCDDPTTSPSGRRMADRGEVICFVVTVARRQGVVGVYTATMAAYGTDGSVDRREFSVTFVAPEVAGDAALGALRTPLPAKVNWEATSWLPSPYWHFFDEGMEIEIPISPQLASRSATGTLAGNSSVATTATDESKNALTVSELRGAGEYTGKVSFGTGTEADLTVRIADAWPLFVVTLLLGLWIAHWLDKKLNRQEPRIRLQIALQRIRDEALRAQRIATETLRDPGGGWQFDPEEPWKVWSGPPTARVEDGGGILAEESVSALRAFDAAEDSSAARESWNPEGDAVRKIGDLVSLQRSIQLRAEEIARLRGTVRGRLIGAEPVKFDRVLDLLMNEAVKGRVITGETNQEDITAKQDEARDLLIAYREALDVIDYQRDQLRTDPSKLQELDRLRGQLFSPAVHADGIKRTTDAIRALVPVAAQVPGLRRRPLRTEAAREVSTEFAGATSRVPRILQQLEADLRRSETISTLVAGGIVLLAGLSALYLGKPAWGMIGDYATAILWGSVGGGAVKIALRLLPVGSALWR